MDFKSFRPLFSLIIPTPLKRYTLSRNLEFHETDANYRARVAENPNVDTCHTFTPFFPRHAKHRASVATTKQTVDPDFVKSRKVREEIDTLRKF